LERDSFRGGRFICAEVAAALNLELEAISHIASSVDLDSEILIGVRTHPVRPVVFEGMAIVDQQFNEEGPRRAMFRHGRRFGVLEQEREPRQYSVEVAEVVEEECQHYWSEKPWNAWWWDNLVVQLSAQG
jgi:hypothetical protein